MAYVVKLNYGSFSFESFDYFLFATLISVLQSNPKLALSPRVFRAISVPSQNKRAEAIQIVFDALLNDNIAKFRLALLEIKQRKIVKAHYAQQTCDQDYDIRQRITTVIAELATATRFPVEQSDFTEVFRLIYDLGNTPCTSLAHNDRKINEQIRTFNRQWAATPVSTPAAAVETMVEVVPETDKKSDSSLANQQGEVCEVTEAKDLKPGKPMVSQFVQLGRGSINPPYHAVGPSVPYEQILPQYRW